MTEISPPESSTSVVPPRNIPPQRSLALRNIPLRQTFSTRVLNPNASETSYKPKQCSYKPKKHSVFLGNIPWGNIPGWNAPGGIFLGEYRYLEPFYIGKYTTRGLPYIVNDTYIDIISDTYIDIFTDTIDIVINTNIRNVA